MATPDFYDDIRDNENKKWKCYITDRGYQSPVSISRGELYIQYGCEREDGTTIETNEVSIDLGDYPRLLSKIYNQLEKVVKEY